MAPSARHHDLRRLARGGARARRTGESGIASRGPPSNHPLGRRGDLRRSRCPAKAATTVRQPGEVGSWEGVTDILSKAYGERAAELGLNGIILRVLVKGPRGSPDAIDALTFTERPEFSSGKTATSDEISPSKKVAVASATKLVNGLLILRLIEKGLLSFDDTLGGVLGVDGVLAPCSVDQLCGCVGGINKFNPVVFSDKVTLSQAADVILGGDADGALREPGTTFAYCGSQAHLVAAMCEALTGKSWADLFEEHLKTPLTLTDGDLVYTTNPGARIVTENPMIAGGLIISADEYSEVLKLVLNKGRLGNGEVLISERLIDRLFRNHYTDAEVVSAPLEAFGYDYRYGFCSWLDGEGSPAECDVISSAGFNGFVPFLDRKNGYAAIIVCESANPDAFPFGVDLAASLKPAIIEALGKGG